MQGAALEALQAGTIDVLEIVKGYAPRGETGDLADSLKVDEAKAYGASRVLINIISDSPYFNWITRGIPSGGMTVGQAGKLYANKGKGIIFVGPWTWKERAGNNFPKDAIRDNLPKILGAYKKNFVTRLKGPR